MGHDSDYFRDLDLRGLSLYWPGRDPDTRGYLMPIRGSPVLMGALSRSYQERRREGFTQEEIARDLGVSRTLIYRLRTEGLIQDQDTEEGS